MMANKLQIGMMGDYPLVVNGFTFQSNPESKSPARRRRRLQHPRLRQRPGGAQGFALLRAVRSQGQDRERAVRLRRPRHDAEGDAGPRLAGGLLPAGEPEPGSRHHQPPGKEDRRATPTSCRSPNCCRSAASRARSSTAWRPTRRPGTAWWCARTSPRNIPRWSSPTSRR